VNRGLLFAVCLVPFVILATLNSAGYRFGASDQAFYVPAILKHVDPALFPRDAALIESQAKLTLLDEAVAGIMRVTGITLPILFAVGYVVGLALLAWAVLSLGGHLYSTRAAAVALLFAFTLRHAITKTGTNTLESYFHPRQLAFALGVLSISGYLRQGFRWPAWILVVIAALVHPTTAVWFMVWLGVAIFIAEPRLRMGLTTLAAVATITGVWALVAGPLEGRFVRMDDEWLATLVTKDYLFPLEWPVSAWLVNLAYIPLIVFGLNRRRAAGALTPRESAIVLGALALLGVFAVGLVLHGVRLALAIQMQPARVFWVLDFLATVYVVWLLAEGGAATQRGAAMVAAVVIALTVVRGSYVAYVRFPERSFAQLDIPDTDWGRAMTWARTSDKSSHWLADPMHAARYGTSLRVAGHRDVFVEEIKDSAIGMYDREVAMRTKERVQSLQQFAELTPERARDLAARYGITYLISEQPLALPIAYSSEQLKVYDLR
jgi:hypothetical protein